MKVKIFQAGGFDDISELEEQINEWFAEADEIKIRHIDTTMCGIARDGQGERWQHLVATVWYEAA